MSRNFHNVHVHAPTKKARDQVVKAVLAYAKRAGFSRVKSVAAADRVIRLGGRAPWFSIEDDAYGAAELAKAIAKTKLPVLEAYCEASAFVWLDLYAGGRNVGGWAKPGKKGPPARHVEPLLAKGTPAELAAKWDEGIRQVFPETALAVAAKQLGIPVPQMVGETNLRAVTIALARTKATWTPAYKTGKPAFEVGWGSNGGWAGRHLVFDGATEEHRVLISSIGGPGKGFAIEFSGNALDHIEIVDCKHERLNLERDGNTWRDPAAVIPAGFAVEPETWKMGRRESATISKLKDKLEWYVDVTYRAVKQGECDLATKVTTKGGRGEASLKLMVMWKPWRPSVALDHVSNSQLFAMHRRDLAIAYISLRGSLAEAWAWARPHIETWSRTDNQHMLHVMRDFDVLLQEEYDPDKELPFAKIAPLFGSPTTPFRAAGKSWLFGTHSYAPGRMDPREQLAVSLVLATDQNQLADLEAICDEAIAKGLAHSALVVHQQSRPEYNTSFEQIAVRDDDPLRLAAWHETHVRGVDKRIWLSAELAAGLDRGALPDYATITPVGNGLRVQIPDERMRAELEPLIAALGPLVPTQAEVERWKAAREAQLGPLPVPAT